MEETLETRVSLTAPLIFVFFFILQVLSRFLEQLKKRGSKSAEQLQLRQEIKQLLKEASSFSTPSTFAQAAKLRRTAAAKEKELVKVQELHSKEAKGSYELYFTVLKVVKVLTYLGLSWSFWGVPLAVISQQLLQPFGKVLSWKAGASIPGHVTVQRMFFRLTSTSNQIVSLNQVGILPWLMLTSRVSSLLCEKLSL